MTADKNSYVLRPPFNWWDLRITDQRVELSARFLYGTQDIRGLKDKLSRDILRDLDAAGIAIASGTYEIVGVPPIKVETMAMARDQQDERKAA